MAAIEASPAEVLLAARSTSLDPAQASDDDDIAARWHKWRCLFGRCPVEFEQEPGRRDALKVPDECVHELPLVRRIGDVRVRPVVAVDCKCILTAGDIAGIDAAKPEG